MREMFKKAGGADMEVDAYELREILNAQFTKGQHSFTLFVFSLFKPYKRYRSYNLDHGIVCIHV